MGSVPAVNSLLILNTIMNNSQDTFYFKDRQSRFLLVNKAQAIRLGVGDISKVIGKTDFDFFPEVQARQAYEDEQRIIETGIPVIGKTEKLTWPDGTLSWVSASKYPFQDEDGSTIGTWGITRDITDRKLAEEELERVNSQLRKANSKLEILSLMDALSALYNHRHFYEKAQQELERYHALLANGMDIPFSIILFDIDYFKKINDTYGHLAGDIAIKHVAEILRTTIRLTDMAFRYGGDEFVILMPDTGRGAARMTAERLRKAILNEPVEANGKVIPITISAGVASILEAKDINELLEVADKRLYISKEKGRNCVS